MRPSPPSPSSLRHHQQQSHPSWSRYDLQSPSFTTNTNTNTTSFYYQPPSIRSSLPAMDLNDLPPGSLLNYPDPNDFDYSAFLQATNQSTNNPHAAATSAPAYPLIPAHATSTPLPFFSDSSHVDTPAGSDSPATGENRASSVGSTDLARSSGGSSAAKQRLERRGHTKSRRGCYNCKRRRIKVGLLMRRRCDELDTMGKC